MVCVLHVSIKFGVFAYVSVSASGFEVSMRNNFVPPVRSDVEHSNAFWKSMSSVLCVL